MNQWVQLLLLLLLLLLLVVVVYNFTNCQVCTLSGTLTKTTDPSVYKRRACNIDTPAIFLQASSSHVLSVLSPSAVNFPARFLIALSNHPMYFTRHMMKRDASFIHEISFYRTKKNLLLLNSRQIYMYVYIDGVVDFIQIFTPNEYCSASHDLKSNKYSKSCGKKVPVSITIS